MYLVDSDEATTTGSLVGAACIAPGSGSNKKEKEKLAVEEEDAGEGHEPHS